jgi:hypothetical protein
LTNLSSWRAGIVPHCLSGQVGIEEVRAAPCLKFFPQYLLDKPNCFIMILEVGEVSQLRTWAVHGSERSRTALSALKSAEARLPSENDAIHLHNFIA